MNNELIEFSKALIEWGIFLIKLGIGSIAAGVGILFLGQLFFKEEIEKVLAFIESNWR